VATPFDRHLLTSSARENISLPEMIPDGKNADRPAPEYSGAGRSVVTA
jgi:hypothetical protein